MQQTKKQPDFIKVRIIIEGPAEELLASVRGLKGGKRAVHLSVEVSKRHYNDRYHFLPEIRLHQDGRFVLHTVISICLIAAGWCLEVIGWWEILL